MFRTKRPILRSMLGVQPGHESFSFNYGPLRSATMSTLATPTPKCPPQYHPTWSRAAGWYCVPDVPSPARSYRFMPGVGWVWTGQ